MCRKLKCTIFILYKSENASWRKHYRSKDCHYYPCFVNWHKTFHFVLKYEPKGTESAKIRTLLPLVCWLKIGLHLNLLKPEMKVSSDLFFSSSSNPGLLFMTKWIADILCSFAKRPNKIKLSSSEIFFNFSLSSSTVLKTKIK